MGEDLNGLINESKIRDARENFRRDTQEFFDNILLQDLQKSRENSLNKLEKAKLFSQQNDEVLKNLTGQRNKVQEHLIQSRNEIKELRKRNHSLLRKASRGRQLLETLLEEYIKPEDK